MINRKQITKKEMLEKISKTLGYQVEVLKDEATGFVNLNEVEFAEGGFQYYTNYAEGKVLLHTVKIKTE